VANTGGQAGVSFLEFFAANICNPHMRRAYSRAVGDFLAWCARAQAWRRSPLSSRCTSRLGNQSFRATGIVAHLKNGGTLEKPPQWRTTRLRNDTALRSPGGMRSVLLWLNT
jgi:hypothetical protein